MTFGIGLNITVYTAYHFVSHQWSVATVLAMQILFLSNAYLELIFFFAGVKNVRVVNPDHSYRVTRLHMRRALPQCPVRVYFMALD